MERISDLIRLHLEHTLGLIPTPPLETLKQTEWLPEFEVAMRVRLVMGSLRYGRNFRNEPPGKRDWDCMKRVQDEVKEYLEHGNPESLVDIANHCMLQFWKDMKKGVYLVPRELPPRTTES